MVRPITKDEIPIDRARLALPITNLSAPQTRPIMPATSAPIGRYNDIIGFFSTLLELFSQ
jgi:hypothetical protein